MSFFGRGFHADKAKAAEDPMNVNVYWKEIAAGGLHEGNVGRLDADSLMLSKKGHSFFGTLFPDKFERDIPLFFSEPPQKSADAHGLLIA